MHGYRCLIPFSDFLRVSDTRFASFLRSSFKGGQSVSREPLPCPIPYPWEQVRHSGSSSRQHHRWAERRALEILANLQVSALNFCFLRFPFKCPDSGCRGLLSEHQKVMVAGLRDRMRSACRLVGDLPAGCGSKISSVNEELAFLEAAFDWPHAVWSKTRLQVVGHGLEKSVRLSRPLSRTFAKAYCAS